MSYTLERVSNLLFTTGSGMGWQLFKRPAQLVCFALLIQASASVADQHNFGPVYELLAANCGACHRVGGVSTWVIDLPSSDEKYPGCARLDDDEAQHRCTTYEQLTEAPGDGIPAWIRPHEAQASEPYAQACDVQVSFHIGGSVPEKLPDADCEQFLSWIRAGAKR